MLRNISAGLVGTLLLTLITLLFLPLIYSRLGAEAFGLFAIFLAMQTLFGVLDFGMGAAAARVVASHRAGQSSAAEHVERFRHFLALSLVLAALTSGGLFASAHWIASGWLKLQGLSVQEATVALQLTAVALAFRWTSVLLRCYLAAFELFSWIAMNGVFVAAIRFVGGYLAIRGTDYGLPLLLAIQVLASALETCAMFIRVKGNFPRARLTPTLRSVGSTLRQTRALQSSAAVGGLIWVGFSQSDKVLLSNLVPTSDFGQFTLVTYLAGGISLIAAPVNAVLLPRLSGLFSQDRTELVRKTFHQFSQLLTISIGSIAVTMAQWPGETIYLWTGDRQVPASSTTTLSLYAIGNYLLAMSVCTHYLQMASGRMHRYVPGIVLFGTIFCASLWILVKNWGLVGAPFAWLSINLLYLFLWNSLACNAIVPALGSKWLSQDLLPPLLGSIVGTSLLNVVLPATEGRTLAAVHLACGLATAVVSSLACSSAARSWLRARYTGRGAD